MNYSNFLTSLQAGEPVSGTIRRRLRWLETGWRTLYPAQGFPFPVDRIPEKREAPPTYSGGWDECVRALLAAITSPPREVIADKHTAWLEANDWEIRAIGQLCLAFRWRGLGVGAAEEGWRLFVKEPNPYARVCACWIPVLALLGDARARCAPEYASAAEMVSSNSKCIGSPHPSCTPRHLFPGDGTSYERDACVLTRAFTNWRTGDSSRIEPFLSDLHPYVRETGYLGLGLVHESSADSTIARRLAEGCRDDSQIVRTGAYLALGLLFMNRTAEFTNFRQSIPAPDGDSEARCLSVANGLAGLLVDVTTNTLPSSEAAWGVELQRFLSASNDAEAKDARRALLPLLFHVLFGSFWWGLWVVGVPGLFVATTAGDEHPFPSAPEAISSEPIILQFLKGLRGKLHVVHVAWRAESLLFEANLDSLARFDPTALAAQSLVGGVPPRIVVEGEALFVPERVTFEIDLEHKMFSQDGYADPAIVQDVTRLFREAGFEVLCR